MHILIIDGDKRSRELGSRFLSEVDHEVEIADDATSARHILSHRMPEVIVLDLHAAQGKLVEFLTWIRSMESVHRPYLIMTTVKTGFPGELATALAQGADDFVRKPWLREELIFRVETPQRIKQLQHGGKVMDWSDESDLTTLSCWQHIEQVFTSELTEVICQQLEHRPVQEGLLHSHFAAEIPMTLTQNEMLVQIGVGLPTDSARQVIKVMFDMDDPPDEMVHDLLREFANTAGGAFKRAADLEQVDITTGLPTDVATDAFASPDCVDKRHFMLVNKDEDIHIFFEVELRSKGLHKITIAELREGMVLSKDLLNSSGMMLVRSGTRLTSSNVERLCRLIPENVIVEVAA